MICLTGEEEECQSAHVSDNSQDASQMGKGCPDNGTLTFFFSYTSRPNPSASRVEIL